MPIPLARTYPSPSQGEGATTVPTIRKNGSGITSHAIPLPSCMPCTRVDPTNNV